MHIDWPFERVLNTTLLAWKDMQLLFDDSISRWWWDVCDWLAVDKENKVCVYAFRCCVPIGGWMHARIRLIRCSYTHRKCHWSEKKHFGEERGRWISMSSWLVPILSFRGWLNIAQQQSYHLHTITHTHPMGSKLIIIVACNKGHQWIIMHVWYEMYQTAT